MYPRQGTVLFLIFAKFCAIASTLELKQVQVLARHGDRAPIEGYEIWYPTDPYANDTYAPTGRGGLTQIGSNRAFALGQYLREKYFDRLGISEYSSDTFKIRSSDIERCKGTAYAILSAMFPTASNIPVYHEKLSRDLLFVGPYICPWIKYEKARISRFSSKHSDDEQWQYFQEYLSKFLHVNVTRYHAFILHDTLRAQKSMDLSLPEWTKRVYPTTEFEKIVAREYVMQSYTRKLKRLNGGMWLREFTSNMEAAASTGYATTEVFRIYVGHESNIAGFLAALNIFELHVPEFCSCVTLELHHEPSSNEHQVRIFYRNDDTTKELLFPLCGSPCSLRDFRTLTKHLMPTDADQECGLTA